jgi:hypothetical protein
LSSEAESASNPLVPNASVGDQMDQAHTKRFKALEDKHDRELAALK